MIKPHRRMSWVWLPAAAFYSAVTWKRYGFVGVLLVLGALLVLYLYPKWKKRRQATNANTEADG